MLSNKGEKSLCGKICKSKTFRKLNSSSCEKSRYGELFIYRFSRLHESYESYLKSHRIMKAVTLWHFNPMEKKRPSKLILRERRSYLFASMSSALAALLLFYKLFKNDLYIKILDYIWIAVVLGWLILGNVIHGYFAFRSFSLLKDDSEIDEIKVIKWTFYKSLLINFFFPYVMLIVLFLVMKEVLVATIASVLLLMMTGGCYYLDLRPIMSIKSKK